MPVTEIRGSQIKDTDITVSDIADGAVTNAKRANMAQSTISGRAAGAGTGVPTDLTVAQVATVLAGAFHPRIYTTASTASLTPEIATYDYFEMTAQAAAIVINNHSASTPVGGDKIMIAITSNSSAWGISFGTVYVARGGNTLPTTTVASKVTTMGFIWNAGLAKWNLVAVAQEA